MKEEIAKKYAVALFDLAKEEEDLDTILDEFSEVVTLVEENKELNQMLGHPGLDYHQKKDMLGQIFSEKLSTTLFNFLQLLIDKKREVYLTEIYNSFKQLVDEEQNKLIVAVTAPIELSAKYQTKLKDKLQSILDKEIELEIEVDSDLIGGLVLKIGDKIIDGSVQNYLQEIELDLQTLEVS
ncbi:MAG: F0F1 ATP synthase subunit delta [Bacillota bacterium]